MTALFNIWGVAKYERKMLLRTTKFRILGGIGLAIPIVIGVVLAIVEARGVDMPYSGLGTFMPFYIYSFLQTVVIAFIVGDFRAADERAHIYEVVAARPISTAELVAGKYLGVVGALATLSLGIMLLTLLIQAAKVSITGQPLSLEPYLGYLLIMNVPGLVYMSALTFFLGAILRRQTAVALLIITYALVVLFFLGWRYEGVWDFGAFFAPIYYSDLLGLMGVEETLVIRGFYMCLAIGLFGLSVDRYPRLPQSQAWRWFGRGLVVVGFLGGFATMYYLRDANTSQQAYRQRLYQQQIQHAQKPVADMTHLDLDMRLDGFEHLSARVHIELENRQEGALDTLILSLNPGLGIEAIAVDEKRVGFIREGTVIEIPLQAPLEPHEKCTVTFSYTGSLDTDGFDLLRDEGEPRLRKRDGPIHKGSLTAWITDRSVFLPDRSGWYPKPGVSYGHEEGRLASFFTTNLKIAHNKGLRIITQGEPLSVDTTGTVVTETWVSEIPVPELTINGGIYDVIHTEVHGMTCSLYYYPGHSAQIAFFEEAKDDVVEALGQMIDAMEQESGLKYVFPRLSVVEVPFQIQWYVEGWEETGGLTSPGVLMIEEDALLRQRFRRDFELQNERSRGNREPKQIKRDLFVRAIMSTLLTGNTRNNRFETGIFRSPVVQLWSYNKSFTGEHYALVKEGMPMYLQEDLNTNLSSALFSGGGRRGGGMRGRSGRTANSMNGAAWDTIVSKMQQRSFADLDPEADAKLYRQVLDAKGPTVFKMLKAYMGDSEFLNLVEDIEDEYKYDKIDFASFEKAAVGDVAEEGSKSELQKLMHDWLHSTEVPGYTLTRAVANKVDDGFGMVVYQVVVRIRNGEPGRGFVQITAMGRGDEAVKGVEIEGGQEVEVAIIMWEQPFRVMVEPFFARNRRTLVSPVRVSDQVKSGFPESYVKDVTGDGDTQIELVVDNDDDGFGMPVRRVRKYLRPQLKGGNWRERTVPMAFGRYENNYRFKGPGDGAQPAIWEAEIPKTGEYDVAYYFLAPDMARRMRIGEHFSLYVFHGTGIDTLHLNREEMKAGWNLLGRYRFAAGEQAQVELPDLGSGFLYADAVRWRFHDPNNPWDAEEDEMPTWNFGGRQRGDNAGRSPGGSRGGFDN